MIQAVVVVVLALWAFCTYLLPAVISNLLPDIPNLPVPSVPDSPRGDGFGPFPLPDPHLFGSACTTPAPRPTVRGGLSRAVSDAGSVAHRLTTGPPPDVAEVRSWLMSAAVSVGSVWGTFEAAMDGRPYVPPAQQVTDPPPAPAPAPSSGVALAARAAASAGWTGEDLVTAVAIVGPESGYVPTAANPMSSARGLWQVMVSAHGDKIAGRDILDPYVNASVAYQIWQEAGGFSAPWPTFRSGAHLPYMDAARAAVAALPGTGVVQAGYTPAADCEPGVIPVGDQGAAGVVIAEAKTYLGVPYVRGGNDPAVGIDCSRLTELAFDAVGVDLPPVSWEQVGVGVAVPGMSAALPGDLIFYGSPITTHVGLYLGGGEMIHAPRPGKVVEIVNVYGSPSFIRRILTDRSAVA